MSEKRSLLTAGIVIAATIVAIALALASKGRADIVSAAASIAVAGATFLLALVTYMSITDARRSALAAQRALARPVLVPADAPSQAALRDTSQVMINIRNDGSGVAFNIWGLLMPFSQPIAGLPPQFSMRFPFPVQPSSTFPMRFDQGGTMFSSSDQIAGISVSVPKELEPDEGLPDTQDRLDRVVARLTLSYDDPFGQIHCAVFDLTHADGWAMVSMTQGIEAGIRQIDDAKTTPRKPRRNRPGA